MKPPTFDFMAEVAKDEYIFLTKEAPQWKVVSFKNGKITNKTCKTDARMLRYVRRVRVSYSGWSYYAVHHRSI